MDPSRPPRPPQAAPSAEALLQQAAPFLLAGCRWNYPQGGATGLLNAPFTPQLIRATPAADGGHAAAPGVAPPNRPPALGPAQPPQPSQLPQQPGLAALAQLLQLLQAQAAGGPAAAPAGAAAPPLAVEPAALPHHSEEAEAPHAASVSVRADGSRHSAPLARAGSVEGVQPEAGAGGSRRQLWVEHPAHSGRWWVLLSSSNFSGW